MVLMTLPVVTARSKGDASELRDKMGRLGPGCRQSPTLRAGAAASEPTWILRLQSELWEAAPTSAASNQLPVRCPDTCPCPLTISRFPGFDFHMTTPSRGKFRSQPQAVLKPLEAFERSAEDQNAAGVQSHQPAVQPVHAVLKAPPPQMVPRTPLIGQLQGPALSRLSDCSRSLVSEPRLSWYRVRICPFKGTLSLTIRQAGHSWNCVVFLCKHRLL